MTAYAAAASGAWETATNWTPNGVPGNGDTASIGSAFDMTINGDRIIGTSPAPGTDAITCQGNLTVASGLLTHRGDITISSTKALTVSPGAGLKHDSSLSADPPNTSYRVNAGTGLYQTAALVINGAVDNRCTVTSETANGAAQGIIKRSTDFNTGAIRAQYCDFSKIGTATEGIHFFCQGVAARTYLDHCTFDECGPHGMFGMSADDAVRYDDCVFTNSLGAYNIKLSGTTSPAEALIRDVVFDKTEAFGDETAGRGIATGWTITRCYFPGRFSVGNGGGVEFSDCMISEPNADPVITAALIKDNVFFQSEPDTVLFNPHYLSYISTSESEVEITGNLFQCANTNAQGDCILIPNNDVLTNIHNNVVLPNSAGDQSGTLITAGGGASTGTVTIRHNTLCTSVNNTSGCVVGEGYAGHTGMIDAIQSNLAFHATAAGYIVRDLTGSATDIAASSAITHNGAWNVSTKYSNLSFSSGTPGANDVSGDPQFVDATRSVPTWDIDGLGTAAGTAWADATGYVVGDVVSAATSGYFGNATINYRCITSHTSADADATDGKPGAVASWRTNWEFASLYRLREDTTRIPTMVTWLKGGFAPQNEIYKNAGHDSVTIGAQEGVFGPAKPILSYYHNHVLGA